MIGVFDSGAGGLSAIAEIRKLSPEADVCFFADKKNAPYGTKTPQELLRLVKYDIIKLRNFGANKILMACCTASTVYSSLPKEMREISVPIILPTAKEAARVTKHGSVGVIATEATVASQAFTKQLSRFSSVKEVFELPLQRLVALVEGGASDNGITKAEKDELYKMLLPIREKKLDTLILGCTHFPHLEREIEDCLPKVKLISSSREGAREILKNTSPKESGKTFYL